MPYLQSKGVVIVEEEAALYIDLAAGEEEGGKWIVARFSISKELFSADDNGWRLCLAIGARGFIVNL